MRATRYLMDRWEITMTIKINYIPTDKTTLVMKKITDTYGKVLVVRGWR